MMMVRMQPCRPPVQPCCAPSDPRSAARASVPAHAWAVASMVSAVLEQPVAHEQPGAPGLLPDAPGLPSVAPAMPPGTLAGYAATAGDYMLSPAKSLATCVALAVRRAHWNALGWVECGAAPADCHSARTHRRRRPSWVRRRAPTSNRRALPEIAKAIWSGVDAWCSPYLRCPLGGDRALPRLVGCEGLQSCFWAHNGLETLRDCETISVTERAKIGQLVHTRPSFLRLLTMGSFTFDSAVPYGKGRPPGSTPRVHARGLVL